MRTRIVLFYHQVGALDADRDPALHVPPEALVAQVRLLRREGFTFQRLTDSLRSPDERVAVLTFDDGYRDNLVVAAPQLAREGVPATVFVVTGEVSNPAPSWRNTFPQRGPMLSWDDIGSLRDRGWEIGSHAHRHLRLPLSAESEQREAIAMSVESLRRNVGIRPTSFSYPYGACDATTERIVREAGFSCAVTTRPHGPVSLAHPFTLPRLSMGGGGLRATKQLLKLWGACRNLPLLSGRTIRGA